MNDDAMWNTILDNDSGGPSLTSWDGTGLPADVVATLPPPRLDANAPPLSSLLDSGVPASAIATLLPQQGGTGAAMLPSSALAPAGPLYDPDPWAQIPAMDRLAMMYGMSPGQIATIGQQAKTQATIQMDAKDLLAPAVEFALPESEMLPELGHIAGLIADTTNRLAEPLDEQYIQDAPDNAVFQHLNASLAQPYESPNLPGLRGCFSFP